MYKIAREMDVGEREINPMTRFLASVHEQKAEWLTLGR